MGNAISDDSAADEENELLHVIPLLFGQIVSSDPVPQCTSALTGKGYTLEVFDGNEHIFRSVTRMDKPTFERFIVILRSAGLVDTPHISVEEKIIIYLYPSACGKNNQESD